MKKIDFPMDVDKRTEQTIREAMQERADQPECVRQARQEAYAQVRRLAAERKAAEEREKDMSAQTFRESAARDETANAPSFRRRWTRWKSLGSVAAALAVFSGICVTNPAFAARIPLVGHVFEQIGNSLGFQGDYEKYARVLEETEGEIAGSAEQQAEDGTEIQIIDGTEASDAGVGAAAKDSAYSKTANGMTVTLSEVYCNEKALYLSVILETEDAFPETMQDQNGQPMLDLIGSTMEFDYNPNPQIFDAYLDGQLVDEHTYAGVLRVDLEETRRYPVIDESVPEGEKPEDDSQITYVTEELPEQFSVRLHIPRVIGTLPESEVPEMPEDLRAEYEQSMEQAGLDPSDEAYDSYTEEQQETQHQLFTRMMQQYAERYPEADEYPNRYENWWVDGPWDFAFDVTVDPGETITKTVGADGSCKIGEITVTKTPFEIVLDYDYEKALDDFVTVLDADGKPMDNGNHGGSANTFALTGHDTSKVTIYVCDFEEYMDELKGYYYSDDYEEKAKEKTYQQLLEEHCSYSEEVTF